MRIGKETALELRKLRPRDAISLNGETYEVESLRELIESDRPGEEPRQKDEGFIIELKTGTSRSSLTFFDVEVTYSREAVFDGPPPLNPHPDIVFVQDMERNKTYKYRISRKEKKDIELIFRIGEEEVGITSLVSKS